eukprot:CAMPEP_0183357056 /NCGR_PEP_ID=MMETSP0164_2-20130417/45354_1 /TAXON_ID=221442 /ORGANISM="Coccolithus pelagicus ssp braarudi, Strain PLY182g" /LENGTH=124 /DNA_ID=CAMNT_0025530603 /DNA_START=61 /DNA_END=433 /DNA_ORIENTATION=+
MALDNLCSRVQQSSTGMVGTKERTSISAWKGGPMASDRPLISNRDEASSRPRESVGRPWAAPEAPNGVCETGLTRGPMQPHGSAHESAAVLGAQAHDLLEKALMPLEEALVVRGGVAGSPCAPR